MVLGWFTFDWFMIVGLEFGALDFGGAMTGKGLKAERLESLM